MEDNSNFYADYDHELYLEGKYLHSFLFKSQPDGRLLSVYISAHSLIPDLKVSTQRQKEQISTIRLIIKYRLNPVAIEPWLRNKEKRHLLSAKLLLIIYIAECDAGHSEFERGFERGKRAIYTMAVHLAKAAFHLMTGYIQKRVFGLR